MEDGGWKLVVSPAPDGARLELFDLAADPGETRDLSTAEPARARELAALVEAWIEEGRTRQTTAGELEISDDTRESLNALGYTGD